VKPPTDAELRDAVIKANAALTDAPSDDKVYNRKNGAWVEDTGGGGGDSYPEGTAFPTDPAPSTNDKFYRTDLGLLCYFDGARWLTVQEYTEAPGVGPLTDQTGAIGALSYFRFAADQEHDILVTGFRSSIFSNVLQNSTNYWSVVLQYAGSNNSQTLMGSFNTQGMSAGTIGYRSLSPGIVVPKTAVQIRTEWTPHGSPGYINPTHRLIYRLIVT